MPKVIKFSLPVNNKRIRFLNELKANFVIDEVVELFHAQTLQHWLACREYTNELKQVKALEGKDQRALVQGLIKIFGISMGKADLELVLKSMVFREDFDSAQEHYTELGDKLLQIAFDQPLPELPEIHGMIESFIAQQQIKVRDDVVNELALSLKGLNEFQIQQILNLAYQDGGCINASDKQLVLREKQQLIKKSGMLELINVSGSVADIGGLNSLKNWLNIKAEIFKDLDRALRFGVDVPKSVLIIGMPGCGKSLTAKATASLFELPLIRLDVGRLLGKHVGESEHNMRKALSLAEAISPCVLWVDEIEKAFSGVGAGGNNGAHEVTTRLFGHFLTWMQEKDSTVFVVATANDISYLPPEFLRKGRFDELFFVDLPEASERQQILEIHLKRRNHWHRYLDMIQLLPESISYNGADLEAVVKNAIEKAFVEKRDKLTTQDLLNSLKEVKSISISLKGKVEKLKKDIENFDIRKAI